MKKIVFIGGPTASGKTDIALKLAQQFNGELINADSRQIYKYLDIGTNKGNVRTYNGSTFLEDIPIHLVSFLEPDKRYSVYDFQNDANSKIQELFLRGKLPIVVGGTGLYIDALIKNYDLSEGTNLELRLKLEGLNLEQLQYELEKNHPGRFEELNESDKKNRRRLIRLIEKLNSSEDPQIVQSDYNYIFLYPEYNWITLKNKIEQRVEEMFRTGLVEETQNVLKLGYSKSSVGLQGTGYKEVIALLDNRISLQECIELVKISHRQYARRQRTWFEGEGRGYKLIKVKDSEDAVRILKKNEYKAETTTNRTEST